MTKEVKQFITQQKKVFIKINKAALDDINKELDKSTSKKRSNKRKDPVVKSNTAKKRKVIAANNPAVLFLKQYQEDNEGKKAKYFQNITKNYIIDTTDTSKGSQASFFSNDLKKYLKDVCQNESFVNTSPNSIDIITAFEKKSSSFSVGHMKNFLKSLYFPKNSQQRHYFNIYKHIIEMHVYKQYLFKPQSVELYSEQDFIVKFWSYVFEELFSNSGLYLHWGDTKPKKAKKENTDMKIGLRVLYSMNRKQSDLTVGEFAKKQFPASCIMTS